MTPENAAEAGLKDKDVVSVAVNTDGRKTIFGDVVVRVSPHSPLQCISTPMKPTVTNRSRSDVSHIVNVESDLTLEKQY